MSNSSEESETESGPGTEPDPTTESSPTTGAESTTEGISDEQLPEDLRPGDDNPLAEPLEDGEEIEGASLDDIG